RRESLTKLFAEGCKEVEPPLLVRQSFLSLGLHVAPRKRERRWFSCCCSGPTTTAVGVPSPSQVRCTLVPKPPWVRPSAWTSGSPVGPVFEAPAAGWWARSKLKPAPALVLSGVLTSPARTRLRPRPRPPLPPGASGSAGRRARTWPAATGRAPPA